MGKGVCLRAQGHGARAAQAPAKSARARARTSSMLPVGVAPSSAPGLSSVLPSRPLSHADIVARSSTLSRNISMNSWNSICPLLSTSYCWDTNVRVCMLWVRSGCGCRVAWPARRLLAMGPELQLQAPPPGPHLHEDVHQLLLAHGLPHLAEHLRQLRRACGRGK